LVVFLPGSSQSSSIPPFKPPRKDNVAPLGSALTPPSSKIGEAASVQSKKAAPTSGFFEENVKIEDLKPAPDVEDPRKEENSPSTVGGIVKRYSNKTVEAISKVPGATVSFMAAATR